MKMINATEFKTKCFSILEDIERRGVSFTILRRGKAVAEIRPLIKSEQTYPQQELQGSIQILADITLPIVSDNEIELEQDNL